MTNDEVLLKLEEDVRLRGFTSATVDRYLTTAKVFFRYYEGRQIVDLNEHDIRDFLKYLMNDKKLVAATVNNYNGVIRFIYEVTLEQRLNFKLIPRSKIVRPLPNLLTVEEIQALFNACGNNLRDRAILMTIYGGGLRLSELCNLKTSDIYASSMRILIRQGKGKKDRFTILSKSNLDIITKYWYAHKPNHPENYLFLSRLGNPLCPRAVQKLFHKYLKKAGIKKHATVHTLRHDFATHLLQAGTDVFRIKNLLGHTNLKSTSIYLHLLEFEEDLISPLDLINQDLKVIKTKKSPYIMGVK
jgi:site-specific recombinase XerD